MKKNTLFCASILLLTIVANSYSQDKLSTLNDVEGNKYKTLVIGKQEWMAENLRTTRFNDGTAIPNIVDKTKWMQTTAPAYSWYDNDISNQSEDGGLYNWHAVNTGKLCPKGWRVPTDHEWTILTDCLGDNDVDFKELERIGFSATPAGYRYGYFWGTGLFYEKGVNGYWWTGSECTNTHAWSRTVSHETSKVYRSYFEKNDGFSVRCIRVE